MEIYGSRILFRFIVRCPLFNVSVVAWLCFGDPWRNHQCFNLFWFMWWFNYCPETRAALRCGVLLSGCSFVDLVGRASKSDLSERKTSLLSWDSWQYQIWFEQSRGTNIPTVLSFHILCITFFMHIKGWKG